MTDITQINKRAFLRQELSGYRRMVVFAGLLLVAMSIWQFVNTLWVHKTYQDSLMDTISDQVIDDYGKHLNHLRTQVDKFQIEHKEQLVALYRDAHFASREDYIELLTLLRSAIEDVRLFAIIDKNGDGILIHITGDFLPDCKHEIETTLLHGSQEQLFFHHSLSSVHYDLLQPFVVNSDNAHFFVGLNIDKFEELLKRYRLPQQELFLLRNDEQGKVELSTNTEYQTQPSAHFILSEQDLATLNYVKPIPNTRWNVSIRLSGDYLDSLVTQSLINTLSLFFVVIGLLFFGYKFKKNQIIKHYDVLKKMAYAESYDELTGLPNRTVFVEILQNEMIGLEKQKGNLFYIDLDKFQTINNVVGYSKGERCLNIITNALSKHLSTEGHLARIGNDQFAVFEPNQGHGESLDHGEALRKLIKSIDFSDVDEAINITACVGVVELHNDWVDVHQAMSAVMLAADLAKSKGRDKCQLYQAEDPALTRHSQEMEILKHIRKAISDDSFVLYRQQIQSANGDDNEIFEVLLRLETDSGEIVSPSIFIRIAEQHHLVASIDKLVIQNTLERISLTQDKAHYCINLSGQTLATPNLIEFVSEQFKLHQVPPQQITFEITETYAITHLESAIKFITQVTHMGCQFALDDFGSGLSSFSYLQQLPVQKLKLDGTFIKNLNSEPKNRAFVQTMVALAKSMEMETVAEFVETEDEFSALKELGLDYFQGYHLHKPTPW